MEKIVIKKMKPDKKPKRTSIVVKPETYIKVYTMAHTANMPMETFVDKLLTEALKAVVIEEEETNGY